MYLSAWAIVAGRFAAPTMSTSERYASGLIPDVCASR